jgi:hypothetical protein
VAAGVRSGRRGEFPKSRDDHNGELFKEYRVYEGENGRCDARVAHALTSPVEEVSGLVPRVEGPGWLATMPDGETDMLSFPGYVRDEEQGWVLGHHPLFNDAHNEQLQALLNKYRNCFAHQLSDLTGYKGDKGAFTVPLLHQQDIRQKCRSVGIKEREILDSKMGELRDSGFIVPAPNAKYVQNVVIVAKKDAEGNFTDSRVCVDYRPINAASALEHYQMPTPEQLFEKVGDCCVFSKVDMKSGFHQIEVAEIDQPKTAFWWGNKPWMYKRAPFGLKNIPAFFQQIMDYEIAKAGLEYCCACYIDDILVFSKTPEQHLVDLEKVLQMLEGCGLKAHPEKSLFAGPVVEYLGHNVSGYGISPMKAKVAAIEAMPAPTTVPELRHVLGFLNYYRGYVPDFSKKAHDMNSLLKSGVVWNWGTPQEDSFRSLKEDLCTPGLVLKRFNPAFKTVVHTDWSAKGIGAVLGQYDPNDPQKQEYMVACISRSLNKHEKNYSSCDGETLAAVWAIKSFRKYLLGMHFELITDHSPLTTLLKNTTLTGKHARWALALQEFDFKVMHRAGKLHQNADVPSRHPQASTADLVGARLDSEGKVGLSAVYGDERPALIYEDDDDESYPGISACLAEAADYNKDLSVWDCMAQVSLSCLGYFDDSDEYGVHRDAEVCVHDEA